MTAAVGIDFGTSKSVVCVIEDGSCVIVPNSAGSRSTPSVVAFARDGDELVGEVARRQAVTNAARTIQSVKRHLGTGWTAEIDGERLTSVQISAIIMRKLVNDATSRLGQPVTDAIITVPCCFDEPRRQAVREAGRTAGLNVLRIIAAPVAAALAYHLQREDEATILVFDLGGGTLEVCVLEVSEGAVEVKATSGDCHLGGDDWDQRIVDHLLQQARDAHGADLSADATATQRLRDAAEQAKIDLSSMTEAWISLPFLTVSADGPVHLDVVLTRTEFEQATADLLGRCKDAFEDVIKESVQEVRHIDRVLLTGGATRMPAVASLIRELAAQEPARGTDEDAASGVAWQAGCLTRKVESRILLLDATQLSLGIETSHGNFTRMIYRNTTVPTRRSWIFTINTARLAPALRETDVMVPVYQGEHAVAADNRLIGMLELTSLPLSAGKEPRIEVCFDLDANSDIHVSAKDLDSGKNWSTDVTSTPMPSDGTAGKRKGWPRLEGDGPPPPGADTAKTGAAAQAAQEAKKHNLGQFRQSFTAPKKQGLFRKPSAEGVVEVVQFERGLVLLRASSPPSSFRWDQIRTVLQSSTERYVNHVYQGTRYSYTFTCDNGMSWKPAGTYMASLSGSIEYRYATLCENVARHAADAQLPGRMAALDRGEDLTFGDMVINARGVRTAKHDMVPWAEISDLQVERGYVRIKKAGKFLPLSLKPVSQIPNFLVFITLADTLRKRSQ
jgi:molecular chaperone DnaK